MKSFILLTGAILLAGCASRPSAHPFIPPQAMYSGTGIVAAQGGVLAASYGAHLLDGRKSTRARRTGSALVAAGAAMMGAAVLDAVRVKAEREMLLEFDAAFRRDMRGAPSVDSPLPPPLPPPPIIPWEFMEKSPLAGEGP